MQSVNGVYLAESANHSDRPARRQNRAQHRRPRAGWLGHSGQRPRGARPIPPDSGGSRWSPAPPCSPMSGCLSPPATESAFAQGILEALQRGRPAGLARELLENGPSVVFGDAPEIPEINRLLGAYGKTIVARAEAPVADSWKKSAAPITPLVRAPRSLHPGAADRRILGRRLHSVASDRTQTGARESAGRDLRIVARRLRAICQLRTAGGRLSRSHRRYAARRRSRVRRASNSRFRWCRRLPGWRAWRSSPAHWRVCLPPTHSANAPAKSSRAARAPS